MGLITGHVTIAEPGRPVSFNIGRRSYLLATGELEKPTGPYAEPGKLRFTDVEVTECTDRLLLGWNVIAYRNGYRCQQRYFSVLDAKGCIAVGQQWMRWLCAIEFLPATSRAIITAGDIGGGS